MLKQQLCLLLSQRYPEFGVGVFSQQTRRVSTPAAGSAAGRRPLRLRRSQQRCVCLFDSEEYVLVLMECPAWCSGGRRPLIAGCLSLQRLGMDLPVIRPVCQDVCDGFSTCRYCSGLNESSRFSRACSNRGGPLTRLPASLPKAAEASGALGSS